MTTHLPHWSKLSFQRKSSNKVSSPGSTRRGGTAVDPAAQEAGKDPDALQGKGDEDQRREGVQDQEARREGPEGKEEMEGEDGSHNKENEEEEKKLDLESKQYKNLNFRDMLFQV